MMYEEFLTKQFYPFLRRKISIYLVRELNYSQKQTAKILNLTEGAVSQYINSKRGMSEDFEKINFPFYKQKIKIMIDTKKDLRTVIQFFHDERYSQLLTIFHKRYGKY